MSSHTLQQGDLRKDEIMALVRKLTVHSLWNTPEIRTSLTQAQREAVLDAMRQQREYGYSLEQVIKSDKKWLSDVEADYQDWDKHRNSPYKSWRVEIIKSLQSPFLRERNKKVGEGAGKAMLQSGE